MFYGIFWLLTRKKEDYKMTKRSVVDHKGNVYNNVLEMCNAYNLKKVTFYHRKKSGWSLEECLWGRESYVEDHVGNRFSTLKDMCKYYGLSASLYTARLKRGFTVEEALLGGGKYVEDHKGNRFATLKEMCKYWGISYDAYMSRIKVGRSQHEALTVGVERKNPITKDHLGNEYPTFKAMCEAYGLTYSVVYRRLTVFGFSLEAALTTPKNVKGYKFLDGVERRDGITLKKDNYTSQYKLVEEKIKVNNNLQTR